MSRLEWIRFAAPIACLLLLAGAAASQEGHEQGEKPSHDEMMEAWMKVSAPGPHHEHFKNLEGTWTTTSVAWMDPNQPPMESTGEATLELLMDGRFLQEISTAVMMDMPWEGRGIFGFNNVTGKHIATWFDSFGTLMIHFEGVCENHCGTVTTFGSYMDVMTGTEKTMKVVSRKEDDDRYVTEIYSIGADGTEHKDMEATYTRAGD